jgi:hypothetical protein
MQTPLRKRTRPIAFLRAIIFFIAIFIQIGVFAAHLQVLNGAFYNADFVRIVLDGIPAFRTAGGFLGGD